MKLYIDTKLMIFEEDNIEHEIVLKVSDEEFYGYDIKFELSDDDKFIKNVLKIFYKKDKKGKDIEEIDHKEFVIREQKTWNSFPLYEIIDGKIVKFDYTKYDYFANTDRRMALMFKINDLYNPPSEAKILRKTIKFILDELKLDYPDFLLYNKKVEEIIKRNPKDKIK
ncbi:hypothetical protein ES695_01910 [Candidatus Atribacteria bacterium 1244-E10-H5-B2]|nr:MAG: hypothetical protein ES695_01910 [Candidatus Atribacteria bacterium 1244-E10-H5-B2]